MSTVRTFDRIAYDVAGGVATIALDDPDTRNALSDELMGSLIAAFTAARDDEAVRCVVLASTHPRTFSSGGNLGGFAGDTPLVLKHRSIQRFPDLFTLIGTLGKPVVAKIGGHCLAGAFGLALACDLVIASDAAVFGTPEINVGVFPFMIAALLYRNLPRKTATELMLLGERFDADEARRIGVVNRVVPAGELDAATAELAGKLAVKSPLLMQLGKDALWRQGDMPLQDAWDYLRSQLALAFSTEDIQEGVAAFKDKREPEWKGR
jgi:enoyl-CoA hydratase/carnithine racemase